MESYITLEQILAAAKAVDFTSAGLREAKHYKHFKSHEAAFVKGCLETIGSRNNYAIFIYGDEK